MGPVPTPRVERAAKVDLSSFGICHCNEAGLFFCLSSACLGRIVFANSEKILCLSQGYFRNLTTFHECCFGQINSKVKILVQK
eukprot:g13704.t1